MSNAKPTLAEVIEAAVKLATAGIRVGLPGIVQDYDATTQRASVLPAIKDAYVDEGGETRVERMPVVVNVPVVFPGAGGYRVTFPVQPGDQVWLMFCDADLDRWLVQGGEVDPGFYGRTHHLKDAVAIPGLHDFGHPISDAGASHMTMGAEGGAQVHVTPTQVGVGDDPGAPGMHGAANGDALDAWFAGAFLTWAGNLSTQIVAAGGAPVTPPATPTTASTSVKIKP